MSLRDLIVTYRDTQQRRKTLEAQAKEVKKEEDSIKENILQEMRQQEMQSIKYPDVGHVIIAEKSHYEVRDKPLFCQAIIEAMLHGYKKNRPLDDAAIVQLRVSKEALEVFLEETQRTPETVGLAKVSVSDLQVRKA